VVFKIDSEKGKILTNVGDVLTMINNKKRKPLRFKV
jgi:hypothetical protein